MEEAILVFREKKMESGYLPLFETKEAKGRVVYRVFAASIFVGICLIWSYRVKFLPEDEGGRWVWLGLSAAEVWFGFYWVLTQAPRWNPIHRLTFKHNLSKRSLSNLSLSFCDDFNGIVSVL